MNKKNDTLRILFLVTRNPYGSATGRKSVLKTIIGALQSIGHELDLIIFDQQTTSNFPYEGNAIWMPRPSYLCILKNIASFLFYGKTSLNEALYYSPKILDQIRAELTRNGYDIVIADMIRMAPYAAALGIPWILDLDDLLSKRYNIFIRKGGPRHMLLGYYLESIPRVIRPVAKLFATFLIKRESIILEQREIEWSKKADIVSLVSAEEALDLQKKVNRPILSLPMAVDIPEKQQRTQFAENITSAVFVGGLDYQPNLDAIRFYHKKIIPILEAQGLGNFTLEVIGKCTTAVKQEFNTTNIRFLGYVDNLQKELSKYSLFFAPIVSGSGVKTKVLEAMASGLPVVSTNSGVSGLKVENGIHCLIADTPEQFAESVQSAVTNPMLLRVISKNAHRYVVSHFSRKAIEKKWDQAIKSLT